MRTIKDIILEKLKISKNTRDNTKDNTYKQWFKISDIETFNDLEEFLSIYQEYVSPICLDKIKSLLHDKSPIYLYHNEEGIKSGKGVTQILTHAILEERLHNTIYRNRLRIDWDEGIEIFYDDLPKPNIRLITYIDAYKTSNDTSGIIIQEL